MLTLGRADIGRTARIHFTEVRETSPPGVTHERRQNVLGDSERNVFLCCHR